MNVYIAFCNYKLDFYDNSIQSLEPYLAVFPNSPTAVNLKACNQYRIYHRKEAEQELRKLKHLTENELNFAKDIIAHNMVTQTNVKLKHEVYFRSYFEMVRLRYKHYPLLLILFQKHD